MTLFGSSQSCPLEPTRNLCQLAGRGIFGFDRRGGAAELVFRRAGKGGYSSGRCHSQLSISKAAVRGALALAAALVAMVAAQQSDNAAEKRVSPDSRLIRV